MSQPKGILILAATFLSLFVGLWTSVFGISIFQNYNRPYLFASIFGGIGIVLGVFLAHRLKTTYIRYTPRKDSFWVFRFSIAVGFVGLTLWAAALTNNRLATMEHCGRYVLINKSQTANFHRTPKIFYLFVDINGQENRLISNGEYWSRLTVGKKIGICRFKSRIGFDYQKLMDE